MPIKYTRDGANLDPLHQAGRWPQPQLRRRLLLVYAGLSFVALLLIGYFIAADRRGDHGPSETTATVLEKHTLGQGQFELVLEVALPDSDPVRTSLLTDESSWNGVETGDEIVVEYERPFLSKAVRIYRMRMNGASP